MSEKKHCNIISIRGCDSATHRGHCSHSWCWNIFQWHAKTGILNPLCNGCAYGDGTKHFSTTAVRREGLEGWNPSLIPPRWPPNASRNRTKPETWFLIFSTEQIPKPNKTRNVIFDFRIIYYVNRRNPEAPGKEHCICTWQTQCTLVYYSIH